MWWRLKPLAEGSWETIFLNSINAVGGDTCSSAGALERCRHLASAAASLSLAAFLFNLRAAVGIAPASNLPECQILSLQCQKVQAHQAMICSTMKVASEHALSSSAAVNPSGSKSAKAKNSTRQSWQRTHLPARIPESASTCCQLVCLSLLDQACTCKQLLPTFCLSASVISWRTMDYMRNICNEPKNKSPRIVSCMYQPGQDYHKIIPWNIFFVKIFVMITNIVPPEDFLCSVAATAVSLFARKQAKAFAL